MNGLLHKARKPKFELTLQIIDLSNVPLVAGQSYIKWHLPMSTAAEHRGATQKAPIKDHKVTWDYQKKLLVRLSMDKTNMLQECSIDFEMIQDYNSAGRSEKITIGRVHLNLAEYADIQSEDGEIMVRRYLMQDSKINSTVKIGLGMVQVDGDRNFIAPPLRTAAVFEGFTGVITSEQEPKKPGYQDAISMTKEVGELHDMYRLALAASWAGGSDELAADKCIEDIFNGGDGWGNKPPPETRNPSLYPITSPNSEDDGNGTAKPENLPHPHNRRNITPNRVGSSDATPHAQAGRQVRKGREMPGLNSTIDNQGNKIGGIGKTRSPGLGGDKQGNSPPSPPSSERGRMPGKHKGETVEWAVMDDLRAWKTPVMSMEGSVS